MQKEKRHDKAVGSEVIVVRPIWPIGLFALIAASILLFFAVSSSVTNALSGPLKGEIEKFITPFVKDTEEKAEETNTPEPEENEAIDTWYDL